MTRPRPATIFTVILVLAAAGIFAPFVAPIVLAAWAAHLTRPLSMRTARVLRGRHRAAAVVTLVLVLVLAAPIVLALLTMIPAAKSLLTQLRGASGGRAALAALVSDGGSADTSALFQMVKDYGATASRALLAAAGASLEVAIGALVFFVSFFALLVEGERARAWMEESAPIDREVFQRMARAFHQAGRGLLVGTGLTALVQGALATIIYAAVGVPRALLFGLLSTIAALIPTTGATIVWIPIATGLAITGHGGRAVILSALCLGVVGTVDNVMRPWLAKRADVGLPTVVLLVSMFGGVAVLGPWGLLLGPLVVRLASEALDIARERRARRNLRSAVREGRDRGSAPPVSNRIGPPSRVPSTRDA